MTTSTTVSSVTAKKPEKKRYLVGIVAGGPAYNVTLGGVSFPVSTSETRKDGTEIERAGAIVHLSADDIKRIKDAVEKRVVRWRSIPESVADGHGGKTQIMKRQQAFVLHVDTRGFEPEEHDEPLANYLIFEEAPESTKPVADSFKTAIARELEVAAKHERDARNDPKDAQVREDHKLAKKLDQKVDRTAQ